MRYKNIKHYDEWLAGQHGGHNGSYQKDSYLYCEACKVRFCTGLSKEAIAPSRKAETE